MILYGPGLDSSEVLRMIRETRRRQGCGVCEKSTDEDNSVWLPAPHSTYAHPTCYGKIHSAMIKVLEIEKQYSKQIGNDMVYAAVSSVRKEAGESLISYVEKNGSSKLKELFDGIGIVAAKARLVKSDAKESIKK